MVRLTRIYTRTGDGGQTRLSDMSLTAKTDPRVEAYGDVDEANSAIGVALAAGELPVEIRDALRIVQNELFDLGADLSNPLRVPGPDDPPALRIIASSIDRLEHWCDQFGDPLPALKSFILPGGSLAAAQLHVARTVTRRAERAAWVAASRVRHRAGRRSRNTRRGQSAGHHVSEPTVGPAVHPDPSRQRRGRRCAVGARP